MLVLVGELAPPQPLLPLLAGARQELVVEAGTAQSAGSGWGGYGEIEVSEGRMTAGRVVRTFHTSIGYDDDDLGFRAPQHVHRLASG